MTIIIHLGGLLGYDWDVVGTLFGGWFHKIYIICDSYIYICFCWFEASFWDDRKIFRTADFWLWLWERCYPYSKIRLSICGINHSRVCCLGSPQSKYTYVYVHIYTHLFSKTSSFTAVHQILFFLLGDLKVLEDLVFFPWSLKEIVTSIFLVPQESSTTGLRFCAIISQEVPKASTAA